MATRRQKAAARRNIKKAQAARKLQDNPAKKKRRGSAKRKTAKRTTRRTAAKRRTTAKRTTTKRRAAPKRRVARRAPRKVSLRLPKRRKGARKARTILIADLQQAHAAAPKRRRRKSKSKSSTARRAAARRPRAAKRRVAKKRKARVTSGQVGSSTMRSNPVRRRRAKKRASARTVSRRRRSAKRRTQTFTVRRATRRVKLRQRNPMHGLGYGGFEENPGDGFFYDDNPLGAISSMTTLRDNPLGGFYDNPMHGYDENPLGGLTVGLNDNPAYEENPDGGAFSAGNMKRFGVAAGGVALGLVVADFLDRYVATRKPAADGQKQANSPWYGRDAAAAQRARPDAYRLGAQAVGAAGSIALAYQLRGKNWAPWVFGGLSLGFGSNLIKMFADWWLMPAIFKVKLDDNKNPDFSKASFASRMYPLEQKAVQDKVKDLFEKWSSVSDLDEAQKAEKDNPVYRSPLADTTTSNVYTLGRPAHESLFGAPRVLAASVAQSYGQVGVGANACPHCGGVGGCFSGCPTSCPGDCPQGVTPGQDSRLCQYTVKPGDDLLRMAASVGVLIDEINALNGGRTPAQYFVAGSDVILPAKLCHAIELGTAGKVLPNLPALPSARTLPPGAIVSNPEPGDPGGPPGPPAPGNYQTNVQAEVKSDAASAIQAAITVPTPSVMPQVLVSAGGGGGGGGGGGAGPRPISIDSLPAMPPPSAAAPKPVLAPKPGTSTIGPAAASFLPKFPGQRPRPSPTRPTTVRASSAPGLRLTPVQKLAGTENEDIDTLGAPQTEADREVALHSFGRDMDDA